MDESNNKRKSFGTRILAEIGLGVIVPLAISGVSALIGLFTALGGFEEDNLLLKISIPLFIVGVYSYPLLSVIGVYVGGKLTGGRGKFWPPLVGAIVSILILSLLDKNSILVVLIVNFIVSILCYELSDSHETKRLASGNNIKE